MIDVVACHARPTSTDVERGVDVDVSATINGVKVEGLVTLLPAADGRPVFESWGDPDMWCSAGLLRAVDTAAGDNDRERLDMLKEIEGAAREAAGQP